MKQLYEVKKTSSRFEARNSQGELVAVVSAEDDFTLRVDYRLPYGWEDDSFDGNFEALTDSDVLKIIGVYFN